MELGTGDITVGNRRQMRPAGDHRLEMRTGVPCPECNSEIVYNGNYYCSQYEGENPTCEWAMPDSGNNDPLFKKCYRGLMANRRK